MEVAMVAHLIESGEMEKLKNLLKERLNESGWREEMKSLCKKIVKEKGTDKITVDELVTEITPKGREKVNEAVKKELLTEIRNIFNSSNRPENNIS